MQEIIVVEDSPEDYEAIRRAFDKAAVIDPIMHFGNGDDAWDFFKEVEERCLSGSKNAMNIKLVLLDLNLPGMDGRDILKLIKTSESLLKKVPVIVFSTSNSRQDVECCYEYGVNSYIQKPVAASSITDAIAGIKQYWLDISLLPESKE